MSDIVRVFVRYDCRCWFIKPAAVWHEFQS